MALASKSCLTSQRIFKHRLSSCNCSALILQFHHTHHLQAQLEQERATAAARTTPPTDMRASWAKALGLDNDDDEEEAQETTQKEADGVNAATTGGGVNTHAATAGGSVNTQNAGAGGGGGGGGGAKQQRQRVLAQLVDACVQTEVRGHAGLLKGVQGEGSVHVECVMYTIVVVQSSSARGRWLSWWMCACRRRSVGMRGC